MMKKLLTILSVFLLTFVLTACGGQQGQNQPADQEKGTAQDQDSKQGQSSTEDQGTETKSQKQAFPVTLTGAAGKKITLKKKPERIVSLIPSNTEITFALGAGDRVVGVSKFDNYPEAVKDIPKIGGQNFNVEKIISLKPDLVLAYGTQAQNKKSGLSQLRKAGIKVLVVGESSNFADVYKSIKLIGKATGTTEKAKEIVSGMKSKVASIKKKAATIPKEERVKVWIEVSPAPDIYTTGSGTFMDQMLDIINAKNVAADKKGWVKYSAETAVKQNPDVIVITYGGFVKDAVKNVLNREGWQNVPAVENKRVYSINSNLVSRPGPRLVKGVEKLAKAVYPDVFKK